MYFTVCQTVIRKKANSACDTIRYVIYVNEKKVMDQVHPLGDSRENRWPTRATCTIHNDSLRWTAQKALHSIHANVLQGFQLQAWAPNDHNRLALRARHVSPTFITSSIGRQHKTLVCQRVALGCYELPSKYTVEFSYSETITYNTKIEFCWSQTTSLILSVLFCDGTSRYGVPENLTTG